MTKLALRLSLALGLAFLGLAQAPASASAYDYCADTCFVWNRDCRTGAQQCICDAQGGAITSCQSCSDNDYMCIG